MGQREDIRQIAGSVQNTDDFDHVRVDPVKDQVFWKLDHGPLPQVAQSRVLKAIKGPAAGRLKDYLVRCPDRVVKTKRLLDAVPGNVTGQFIDVAVGGGEHAKAKSHRLAAFRVAAAPFSNASFFLARYESTFFT